MNAHQRTQLIRNEALRLGFDACGFSRAQRLEQEERRLEEWLQQDRHGTMQWMENHFDKRVDPTKLVPGSKSVVSVIGSYHHPSHEQHIQRSGNPKISKYALGRDYHKVFKNRLKHLFYFAQEQFGDVQGRFFVDSAPVLDRVWAQRAGLGWIGKNSLMLNKSHGSWFFIGELISDLEFEYDTPTTDHCGSCTRCIDACPTDAIYEPYRVDSTKCISYLTIELKDQIPDQFKEDMGEWIYGCDICQDVCPWNQKAAFGGFEDLFPRERVTNRPLNFWEQLTEDQFNDIFEGSAVRRAKYDGLKRNISVVSQNLRD
ncbi:MAG: tRNA epoxyqueuosine(34) reductase QueG [Bacteroidota bacterium]